MIRTRFDLDATRRARLETYNDWRFGLLLAALLGLWLAWAPPRAHAEGLYLELGAGYSPALNEGSNPVSVIRGRYEFQPNGWLLPDVVEWDHHSSIFDGKPFNSRPEESRDQFSIIWRIKIK